MSGHGISPAWVQNVKFGEPLVFPLEVIHAMFAQCDLSFIGDVEAVINMAATCSTETENIDVFVDFAASCVTTVLGDINLVILMKDVIVSIVVTDP